MCTFPDKSSQETLCNLTLDLKHMKTIFLTSLVLLKNIFFNFDGLCSLTIDLFKSVLHKANESMTCAQKLIKTAFI